MTSVIEVPISTRNLSLINQICRTGYEFNAETDWDILQTEDSKLHGIHVLTANNFVLMVQASKKFFPLPFVANVNFIRPFDGLLACEYLSLEIGIFYATDLNGRFELMGEESYNIIESDIQFTKTKVGRKTN